MHPRFAARVSRSRFCVGFLLSTAVEIHLPANTRPKTCTTPMPPLVPVMSLKFGCTAKTNMSGIYSVSNEGTISFPLIGVIEVEGMTPADLERKLTELLADGYLRSPQVSVFVKELKSKSVAVLGEVRDPGSIAYSERMTVIDAIARAGGFKEMARENAVTVTRSTADSTKRYTVPVASISKGDAENFYLRPGDVITVPRRVW